MKGILNFLKDKRGLLIAIVGIILIPTIYINLFLASMWDPYERTEDLPIVIVNEDQPVTMLGQEIAIGAGLVESLTTSDTLHVVESDAASADGAMMDGTYYLEILIPEDFSYKSTTLLSEAPEQMQLHYKLNPGYNFIASKFSQSIVRSITDTVDLQVRQGYVSQVLMAVSQGQLDQLGMLEPSHIQMFLDPVVSIETNLTEVKTNGYAMAPYMMGVGLWIAGLSLITVYPLKKEDGQSVLMHWAKKLVSITAITVIWSLVMLVFTKYNLGFEPASFWKTVLVACVSSLTFMSIMVLIQAIVGNRVAIYFILILLIIQLSCSTGTYPAELSPTFVSQLKGYMPLYYVINLFRRTIFGFGDMGPYILNLILIILAANFLLLIVSKIRSLLNKPSQY